jgi:hypothetical protein
MLPNDPDLPSLDLRIGTFRDSLAPDSDVASLEIRGTNAPTLPKKGDIAFSRKGFWGGYDSYEEYLGSKRWKALSREVRLSPCKCGKPADAVNHLSYEHLGYEQVGVDIEPICNSCHYAFHVSYVYNHAKGLFEPRRFGL